MFKQQVWHILLKFEPSHQGKVQKKVDIRS